MINMMAGVIRYFLDRGCAMKLFVFVLFVACNFVRVSNGEELLTLSHVPDYMNVNGGGAKIRLSEVADLLSTIWGFTTLKDEKWNGINAGNPLRRPEAIVVVEMNGFKAADLKISGTSFPLETDVGPCWPYQLLADRTYIRFADSRPVLLPVANDETLPSLKSQYPSLLKSLPTRREELESRVLGPESFLQGFPLKALNLSYPPDMQFATDVQLLWDVSKIAENNAPTLRNGIPDLFWFCMKGVEELVTAYGDESVKVEEALDILLRVLNKVKDSFVKVYDGNVVVVDLMVDNEIGNTVRRTRSLLQDAEKPKNNEPNYNLSPPASPTYSAAFNMMLFTSLIFWLSVFAISLGIWHMDPGRDSIIYRMTSQRMKKDQ